MPADWLNAKLVSRASRQLDEGISQTLVGESCRPSPAWPRVSAAMTAPWSASAGWLLSALSKYLP